MVPRFFGVSHVPVKDVDGPPAIDGTFTSPQAKIQHYQFFNQMVFLHVFCGSLGYPCLLVYREVYQKTQNGEVLPCVPPLFEWYQRYSMYKRQSTRSIVAPSPMSSTVTDLRAARADPTSLEYILSHPVLQKAFVEHCCQEFSVENVVFYEQCGVMEKLQQQYIRLCSKAPSQLRTSDTSIVVDDADARNEMEESVRQCVLYMDAQFLQDGAPQQVNLSDTMLKRIRLWMHQHKSFLFDRSPIHVRQKEEAKFPDHEKDDPLFQIFLLFQEAKQNVLQLMDSDTKRRFLQSKLFHAAQSSIV